MKRSRFLCLSVLLASVGILPAGDISADLADRLGHGFRPEAAEDFSLPPGVRLDEPLTADHAVAIALWNNAGLQATLAELGLARADLVEAGLLVNPDLQTLFGIGSKPFELVVNLPIQALWQRPKRVALAELNLEGVSQGLVQNGIDLARDVRVAHAELSLAKEVADIAARRAELLDEIADLTDKRLEAGDISRLEAHLVRLEAYTANDRAQQAVRDVELARGRLRLLLGLKTGAQPVSIVDEPVPPPAPGELEPLVDMALSSRPDLRASELAIEAAGKRVGWERSKVFNFVAPLLSSKQIGSDLDLKTGPGLAIEIPIFNRNQGGISRAKAEVLRATLNYKALADEVAFEVRDSQVRVLQAQESLARMRDQILPEVEEAVRLARNAYEDGDISYLDMKQASRPMLDTELSVSDATMRVRLAEAHLSRAVGRKR